MRLGRLLLLAALVAPSAHADDLRPLYVELEAREGHAYTVRVRVPPNLDPASAPSLVLPAFCRLDPRGAARGAGYRCDRPLSGARVEIAFPGLEPANATVVKVLFPDGASQTIALASGVREWIMPGPETVASVASQYTWLGMEHILIGFDHLLFVVCLIWIAGTWQRILVTITGFTLAHSVTLALSALELVRLPVPPVEAVIALSVLFLASEIAKGPRRNLTWRFPVAVSSSFGLLHGLGFAAVLDEIGLPTVELAAGLLFFNIGVEIGQILFALAVIMVLRLVTAERDRSGAQPARLAVGYGVGSISAFWLIERVAGFY